MKKVEKHGTFFLGHPVHAVDCDKLPYIQWILINCHMQLNLERKLSTCIADYEPLHVPRVDVMDELSLEVVLELLIWNRGEQGSLYYRGDVTCDLLPLLHVVGDQDQVGVTPLVHLELPAWEAEAVTITEAYHGEGEVGLREELARFAISEAEDWGTKVKVYAD